MIILQPKVELMSPYGEPIDGEKLLQHIEQCGRTCYKSEDRITSESAPRFVKNIISSGHDSVIEHVTVTAKFTCDRGISHEIVRHRIASYSQESTRYCSYNKDKFSGQVSYISPDTDFFWNRMTDSQLKNKTEILNEWMLACADAEKHYMNLIELGAPAEFARGVLNNATKTEVVCTMNLREWRHFLKLRTSKAAHPQIRQIAFELLKQFKATIPVVFDDIEGADE